MRTYGRLPLLSNNRPIFLPIAAWPKIILCMCMNCVQVGENKIIVDMSIARVHFFLYEIMSIFFNDNFLCYLDELIIHLNIKL